VFNAFALAQPDGRLHCYHKQNPFLWEHCYFEAGRAPLVVETDLGRVGLLTCWDLTSGRAWAAYRGRVDLLLMASAPPRFHRAVLNFPLGQKVYLAQLLPALLRDREALDGLYLHGVAARAAWLGAPVVHAVMAGRFVSEIPYPRLSFALVALLRPRYWRLARQAHLASLRATFYGTSAVFGAGGETLARVAGEEGLATAEIGGDGHPGPRPARPGLAGRAGGEAGGDSCCARWRRATIGGMRRGKHRNPPDTPRICSRLAAGVKWPGCYPLSNH
jgi:predicted amidohydrolase